MSAPRRPLVLAALTAALALVQVAWVVVTGSLAPTNAVVGALMTGVAVTRGRLRLLNAAARTGIGVLFLGSVADRLGLLGGPGSPGVSWGAWGPLAEYVERMLPVVATPAGGVVAVLVTGAEVVLGAALVLGLRRRGACAGASALIAVFGVSMLAAGQGTEAMAFSVPLLVAGAALLTGVPTSWRSGRTVADDAVLSESLTAAADGSPRGRRTPRGPARNT